MQKVHVSELHDGAAALVHLDGHATLHGILDCAQVAQQRSRVATSWLHIWKLLIAIQHYLITTCVIQIYMSIRLLQMHPPERYLPTYVSRL